MLNHVYLTIKNSLFWHQFFIYVFHYLKRLLHLALVLLVSCTGFCVDIMTNILREIFIAVLKWYLTLIRNGVKCKMKVAYLILCHDEPYLVKRIINRLKTHHSNYIFVHVDLKSDISKFYVQPDGANIVFLNKRYNISWGGWNCLFERLSGD